MKRIVMFAIVWIIVIISMKACSDSDHKIYHKHLKVDRHQSEINAINRCQDTGGMVALHPIFYSFTDCKYPLAVRP